MSMSKFFDNQLPKDLQITWNVNIIKKATDKLNDSISSDEEIKPKFKSKKILVSSDEEEIPVVKPKSKSKKILVSSDEENIVKPKSKSKKQLASAIKSKKPPNIFSSSSEDEEASKWFTPFKTPKTTLKTVTEKKKTNKHNLSFEGKDLEVSSKYNKNVKPFQQNKKLSFLESLSEEADFSQLHEDAKPFVKNFKKKKEDLSYKLFHYFNEHVFDNLLSKDLQITWNVNLTRTAGRCKQRFNRKDNPVSRYAEIELSVKVLDNPQRLRDTLIHELCHAACWIISELRGGHGVIWKGWAKKSMNKFPELPVISRCHNYKIECKFTYKCTTANCGTRYGRHSKSIDITSQVCGKCKGKLELLVKRGNGNSESVPETPKNLNPFAVYVKENYGSIKKSKENMKHADVMKELSKEFAVLKTK